ncbi:hypothetical protein P3603_23015 [Vibrio parahaemolyticus]|nr:hypothetical protein [Vibrio parahaemolyticus]
MEGVKGRISAFWRSESGNVYFRLYGVKKPFLLGHGVDETLIPYLAKNLGASTNAIDKGDFYLVTWLGITCKVHLRKDGLPVEWEKRELPYQWKKTTNVLKRRRHWLSEHDYNGYYEPLKD